MFFISKNNIGIKGITRNRCCHVCSRNFPVDPFRHLKFCLRLWGQRDDLLTYCYLLLVLKLSTFIARTVFILRSTSDATLLLEISATYPIPLLVKIHPCKLHHLQNSSFRPSPNSRFFFSNAETYVFSSPQSRQTSGTPALWDNTSTNACPGDFSSSTDSSWATASSATCTSSSI
jgi:hypothetical protein